MTAATNGRRLLSTRETAELLGCSPRNIFRLIDAGQLRPVKFSSRGRLRFPSDQVFSLMGPGPADEEPSA